MKRNTQTQKPKRKPRKLPQILTQDEQSALIDRGNPRYRSGRRNRALISFLLNTGLRLAELCALRWRDISLQTGRIHVHEGKGARDRILWCPTGCLDKLRAWREDLFEIPEWRDGKFQHVFATRDGKPLGHRYVQRLISRYAVGVGIDRPVTPHLLRHTFATDLLTECKSLNVVQAALGHATIQTTMIYLHLTNGQLEDAMRNFRSES